MLRDCYKIFFTGTANFRPILLPFTSFLFHPLVVSFFSSVSRELRKGASEDESNRVCFDFLVLVTRFSEQMIKMYIS